MSFHMACTCGNGLLVPEGYAGRKFLCPRCGQSVAVPHGFTGDRPAGAKATGSVAVAQGTTAPSVRAKGPRALLFGLAFLVLAGVAVGAWVLMRGGLVGPPPGPQGDGPEVSDMALLPPDAQMVMTVRLAELYGMPAVKDAIEKERKRDPNQEDPAARMERDTGLKPDEVERLHVVGLDADKRQGWVVAKTLNPIDREKVLAKLARREEMRHEGRRYYLGKNNADAELAVHFAGPNVVVVADEAGMKRAMEQAARPVTAGPLKPSIAMAETTKSQVILGVNPPGGGLEAIKNNAQTKAFAEVKVARITLDATEKEATLQMTAEAADEQKATSLQKSLTTMFTLLKFPLAFQQLKGGEEAKTASTVTKFLNALKFTAKGKEVHGAVKSDPATVATSLLYLSKLIQQK